MFGFARTKAPAAGAHCSRGEFLAKGAAEQQLGSRCARACACGPPTAPPCPHTSSSNPRSTILSASSRHRYLRARVGQGTAMSAGLWRGGD
jgi:hypothetical protein